jgi:hypothetical protein
MPPHLELELNDELAMFPTSTTLVLLLLLQFGNSLITLVSPKK